MFSCLYLVSCQEYDVMTYLSLHLIANKTLELVQKSANTKLHQNALF